MPGLALDRPPSQASLAGELPSHAQSSQGRAGETGVQELAQRSHRILEALQDGVVLYDESWKVAYVNPAGVASIGLSPQEYLGKVVWDAFPGVREGEFGQALLATRADGVERRVEASTPVVPGKWFEATFVRVPDGVAAVFRDVTARHAAHAILQREHLELERVVQERTAGLETLNRELDAFNYSVSHDLRAHLRGISAFCGLLRDRHADRLPPDGVQIVDRVIASCRDLGHVVDGLLRLTQLTRAPLVRGAVDVSALARRHLERMARDSPSRRVAWTVEPGILVWADRDLMDVVLDNLLSNAWKFTVRTPAARITVARTPEGFDVRDNGAGFDMANASRLFQPFSRLHADHEFEGHGIGLATVARILQRHGGGVKADSQLGVGTTMAVHLDRPPLTVPA